MKPAFSRKAVPLQQFHAKSQSGLQHLCDERKTESVYTFMNFKSAFDPVSLRLRLIFENNDLLQPEDPNCESLSVRDSRLN